MKFALLLIAIALFMAAIARPASAQRLRPPHYNGWVCIHSREGSWDDDGSPYYGGLQMSYNWMGVIVGKASWYPPLDQMWAAEMAAAENGFSYSWMRGQWPKTFPPCSKYF